MIPAVFAVAPGAVDHRILTIAGVPLVDFTVERIEHADATTADLIKVYAADAQILALSGVIAIKTLGVALYIVFAIEVDADNLNPLACTSNTYSPFLRSEIRWVAAK